MIHSDGRWARFAHGSGGPGRLGRFTVSIDFELAWGSWRRQRYPLDVFSQGAEYARRIDVLSRQLRLPFTWAVVGAVHDMSTAELSELPAQATVAAARPALGPYTAPLPRVEQILAFPQAWFARDVVEQISTSPAGHEIATHTYFHACPDTPAGLVADVKACASAAGTRSISTIVYPRDVVRHAEALPAAGVSAYRGPGESWYLRRPDKAPLRARGAHAAAQAFGLRAPLANVIPGPATRVTSSAGLPLREGFRRRIPPQALRRRYLTPLDEAVRSGGTYHLSTHPWNLAVPGSDAFELFAEVCSRASQLREKGDLAVLTIKELADAAATP